LVDLVLYFTDAYTFIATFITEQLYIMIMEQELTSGEKVLNGFLRLMVACLIGILACVPLALIADALGFFKP